LVQVVADTPRTRAGETLVVMATVRPLAPGRPTPTGSIQFLIDENAVEKPIDLNKEGRASLKTRGLRAGVHRIRAVYTPGRERDAYHGSSSPVLLHRVDGARGAGTGAAPYQIKGLFYEAC